MKVPFVDLKAQFAAIGGEALESVRKSFEKCDFILGDNVKEFEKEFASFCSCSRAVGVASGLDAIKLSLRALQIGPGDEVITSANTYIATALAVSAVGAKPVLAEMDSASYNISVPDLQRAITKKTRAIIPVHLYGQPADMDPINELAAKHNLAVVEDASQAHGARYKGRRTGSLGRIAAFSLYPAKNLGACGDAGIVVTNDDALADKIMLLRNYGSTVKYYHEVLGENSRLDTLQAGILSIKLKYLDKWNAARRTAAALYSQKLNGVGDLFLPQTMPYAEHIFHLYVVQTAHRDDLLKFLKDNGVDCVIHYPVPMHMQKAYAHAKWKQGDFPVTEKFAARILSLPMYAEITEEQINYVVETIKRFFSQG